MRNFKKTVFVSAALVALAGGPALAEVMATATTDLNVRSGPGPEFSVVGVIQGGGVASVNGCVENSKWCRVDHNGTVGWAYSDYLTANLAGGQTVVTQQRAAVPVVTYDGGGEAVVPGAIGGAVAGALIAGPVGAAVGGIAGGSLGAAATPPDQVTTYVTGQPLEPIYLDGEVVVGAGLPETIELRQIPDYQYSYVNVNGQPVLVDPASRQIVYVYR
jgi:uncharacterized protein YraI